MVMISRIIFTKVIIVMASRIIVTKVIIVMIVNFSMMKFTRIIIFIIKIAIIVITKVSW